MTTTAQETFIATAPGQSFNPDNAYGLQCKDLPDAYCIALFGNWVDTIRPGNGADVFHNANPAYFEKVANNPADSNQLPPRGSILSYAGSSAVPEGHTAITLTADTGGVDVLQQDGYRQVPAHTARLGYENLIGWLIPRLAADSTPAPAGQTLILPASVNSWNVYAEGSTPVRGNQIAALNPEQYGGLSYEIKGWTQPYVALIDTSMFGRVQIYVGADTPAIIQ